MSRGTTPGSASGSPNLSVIELTEAVIRKQGSEKDLEQLVRSGCDKAALVTHLTMLHSDPGLDDLGFWTGLGRRQLRALIGRVQKCAAELEALNETPFKAVLAESQRAAALFFLPADLRRYARILSGLLVEASGRKHWNRALRLALLLRYVRQQTGTWHDAEVAALVSAVRGGKQYFADAHKEWRRRNYRRLCKVLDQVDQQQDRRPPKSAV